MNEGSMAQQAMNEYPSTLPPASTSSQEYTSNLPVSSVVPVELPAILTDVGSRVISE